MFKYCVLLLSVGCIVQGQVPFTGKCPVVEVQQNFNVNNYLGKWYEAEKYFAIFELNGRCNTATYSLNDNGTVAVHNEQIQKQTGDLHSIVGNARFSGKTDEGKLFVNFPGATLGADAPYWVLETDYDSYSVVWSCVEMPVMSAKFSWILTRERNPSAETMAKAHAVFDKYKLSRADLTKTDQKGCPSD